MNPARMMNGLHVFNNTFGFSWGNVEVNRWAVLRGTRVLHITTPRDALNIYITPTGKMRVFREGKELKGK